MLDDASRVAISNANSLMSSTTSDDSALRFSLIELDVQPQRRFDDRYMDFCVECCAQFETFLGNHEYCPRCARDHVVMDWENFVEQLEETEAAVKAADQKREAMVEEIATALKAFEAGKTTLLEFFLFIRETHERWVKK